MAPTLVQQIWLDLDNVTKEAIEWSGIGRNSEPESWGGVSIEHEQSWANDRIEFVTKTSIGRGLSIALYRLCYPAFESADDVVRLAVKRYKASKANEELPETPGFMGPGTTGDALRAAGGQRVAAQKPTTPIPTASPTPSGPKHNLPETAITAIKKGMANGFDASMFAEMYGITQKLVKEIANG